MERRIYSYLKSRKESRYRKPLVLQVARQVGKTYAVLQFGKQEYDNVAYFIFQTSESLAATFNEDISPSYLLPILSHISGQTITKGRTLIVFDEVQLCERALTSLKYFCEEAPEYHIIRAALRCLLHPSAELKRCRKMASKSVLSLFLNIRFTSILRPPGRKMAQNGNSARNAECQILRLYLKFRHFL